MGRINIRTINGVRCNGHLSHRYQRVQNRASAVIDASDEFGESMEIDLVAHMHRISTSQIKKDMYGDSIDFKKRFGTKSSLLLEKALENCVQEMNKGINPVLVAIAHHVPFLLLRDIEKNPDVKQVAAEFFRDMMMLNENEPKKTSKDSNIAPDLVFSGDNIFNRSHFSSTGNQTGETCSTKIMDGIDGTFSSNADDNNSSKRKRKNSSTSIIICSPTDEKYRQTNAYREMQTCSNIESQESVEKPSKHLKKLFHDTASLTSSQLQMEWSITNVHGVGLSNTNTLNQSLNICYINAIIQCLANTAPFAQWLLNDDNHRTCTLTKNNEFCTCCLLRVIIKNIHQSIRNTCGSFAHLSQASAVCLARRITKLSSNFIPGQQEDPSEFLIILLDHIIQCLSPIDLSLYDTYSHNLIRLIFGFIIESLLECTICFHITRKQNYENVLSIPIISYGNIEEALKAFCSAELLTGDDSFVCSNCQRTASALHSIELANTSAVILIHLKRFFYDKKTKRTQKYNQFISYPESLDLSPFITKTVSQSNEEHDKSNECIYRLYAVVIHVGETVENGHIYSYIRSPDNFWYKANDESITQIDLHTALADNNSYILCYNKITKGNTILLGTQIDAFVEGSSRRLFSSTPIHPDQTKYKTIDDDPSIRRKFPLNISGFDDESPKKFDGMDSQASNTYASTTKYNISCSHSSSEEDLFPLKTPLSRDNVSDPIELQTESRIEIISNKNHECANTSILSRTPHSNVTTEPQTTSFRTKKKVLFSDDTSKSCMESKQLQTCPNTSIGSQINTSITDSQDTNNFHIELSSSHQFKLQAVDLAHLKLIRTTKNDKKNARMLKAMGLPIETGDKSSKKIFLSRQAKERNCTMDKINVTSDISFDSCEEKKESRVDVQYFYILLQYIKQFNGYCSLCIRNCNFGAQLGDHDKLLHCILYCVGRPLCPFKCSLIVFNNGTATIIVKNRTIIHARGNKIARPIREPIRSMLKKQFNSGASVYRVYQERLQKRTRKEQKSFNYDVVGKSRDILRKIKSENVNEKLLASNVDESIIKLREQFENEINVGGKVKGAIQQICKYPSKIVVYTESSLRLFDTLLKHNNVVLSWDATGSIIQEKKCSPRLLYYELSITLPGIVNQDSIVPVSFMISASHTLVDVVHWMEMFKHSYMKVFAGKSFPRPKILLSDRAQVFLIAALKVWNCETLKDFLHRAYRIVNDNYNNNDLEMTNIHACLAHVLLDIRKSINKHIDDQYQELAMWSMALLVNTSKWHEFKDNWKLICIVFIQLHIGNSSKKEYQDALLKKISKIKSDANTADAVKQVALDQDENTEATSKENLYDFCADGEVSDVGTDTNFSRITEQKIVIDEEQDANCTNSPFKTDINEIFRDSLSMFGISVEDALGGASRGILKWFKYLTTFFLPTLPIWSNLLLGDLTRHSRRLVQSFEHMLIRLPQQRTTSISERRMCILKRSQLGGHIHIRLDIVLSILVSDMVILIDEFTNALFNYCTTSTHSQNNDNSVVLDERRLKPIQERWREKCSKRGHGHYTKCPEENVFIDLISSLLSSKSNVNANLKFPSVSPEWLNIAIGLILSTGNNARRHLYKSSLVSKEPVLLDSISTFIEKFLNTTANNTRSTTITFSVPSDESNDLSERCTFILENILIQLLPCHIIVDKVYLCTSCKSLLKIRVPITSIPVNIDKNGLHIERQVHTFFESVSSDFLCSSCNKATVRRLEVVQWPPVLIINVNGFYKDIRFRKLPTLMSLAQFSSWIAIGCASSAVYELVSFNSIIRSGATSIMVRATKIKKSWCTSVNKRLIGDGEQLKRLYAHSRILIFQRVHSDENDIHFINAIIQCSMDTFPNLIHNISPCITLQEACYIIETNDELGELNSVLTANIKTLFYCHSCRATSDALFSLNKQIFIFKLNSSNQIVAYPVLSGVDCTKEAERYCSCCNCSTKNIEMNVYKQIFIKCPTRLMSLVNRNIRPKDAFDHNIKLIDVDNVEHSYEPTAIMIISLYSDTISVIKKESNKYIQYVGRKYSEPIPLSYSEMIDMFDTSSAVLVFHRENLIQTTQQKLRLVSYSTIEGRQQLIVQQGDKYFSIKPAQSSEKSIEHSSSSNIIS